MEGQTERSAFCKVLVLILLIHGVLLFMMAIPLRFILEFRIAMAEIYDEPFSVAIWTLAASGIVWFKPNEKETRVWLALLIFYDIFHSIWVFWYDFIWVVTDLRIWLSLLYIIPIVPIGFYIVTVEFEERDHTTEMYDELINEEIMKHPTIEQGLDYVLDYIDDPQWEFEEDYKESFLEYMAERDDELGRLARERLRPLE